MHSAFIPRRMALSTGNCKVRFGINWQIYIPRPMLHEVRIYLLSISATTFSVVAQSSFANAGFFASWLSSSGDETPNGIRYAPAYLLLSFSTSGAVAAKRDVTDPWRGVKAFTNSGESGPPTDLIAPAEEFWESA